MPTTAEAIAKRLVAYPYKVLNSAGFIELECEVCGLQFRFNSESPNTVINRILSRVKAHADGHMATAALQIISPAGTLFPAAPAEGGVTFPKESGNASKSSEPRRKSP